MKQFLSLFVFMLLASNLLLAQTCCSGAPPITAQLSFTSTSKSSFFFQYSYSFNQITRLYNEGDLLGDNNFKRNAQSSILSLGYGINDKLNISIIAPLNINTTRTTLVDESILKRQALGIGDIAIGAQYNLIQKQHLNLFVGTGVKLPSGSTSKKDDEFGIAFAPDLQIGSGSTDVIFSVGVLVPRFIKNHLSFVFFQSYSINTKSKRFNGIESYKFGNSYEARVGFSEELVISTLPFQISLLVLYKNTRKNFRNGFPSTNSGGQWLYLNPIITIDLIPSLKLNFSAEVPVYSKLNGLQLSTSFFLQGGIRYTLFPKTKIESILDI